MSFQLSPFSRTYREALDMVVEARNYMAYASPDRRTRDGPDLTFCREALRVTSRLTQVMAWLMIHRAVMAGEITYQEACAEQNRLSGHYVCLDPGAVEDQALPDGLRSLLDRSYRLYQRVLRLEQMVLSRLCLN